MGVIQSVVNCGTSSITDETLKTRIKSSNIVALLLALIAGSYVPITLIFVPSLILIPVLGLVIAVLGVILNKVGVNKVARLFIAVAPVTLPAIYHAYLVPASVPSLVPSALVTFAFALIPFVVFKIEEKWGWVPSFLYCAVWLIGFGDFKNYFETTEVLDYSFLQEGLFVYMTGVMAIVLGGGSVFALAYQNSVAEAKSKKSQDEMVSNQKEIEASQDELQKTLEEIEIKKLEEEKRMWANDGMVKFSEILRNNTGEDLYSEVICELVKYVGAKQGKIFKAIDNKGVKALQVEATYAYDRFKYEIGDDGIIEIGEGLVGEAYQEGDTIHITEIPSDYTTITSGLGESNPKAILIFPLMNEEVIEGIIELASFYEFEAWQIEFLSKVGINIATTIARERINTQTAALLEESRNQTEVMQQQEEEMRQNMEEMQATQDMMDEKERELLEEIAKLKKQLH